MKRARSILISAVACVALACAVAVPALAAAPQGTLTSQEYAVLSSSYTKFVAATKKSPVDWAGIRAICRSVGSATSLLKTQSADCLGEIGLLQGLAGFPSEDAKCGSATPHKYLCMEPLYDALAKDAGAMYSADVAARRVAVNRGFTGLCLDSLGDTMKQIAQQRNLVPATEKLAKDMKLIAEVAEGKLASSAINVSAVDAQVKTFEHDADLVVEQSSPKVSVCPHQ